MRIAVAKADAEQLSPQQVAQGIQEQILRAVDQLVRQDVNLCGKKGVYMKFGCRGRVPGQHHMHDVAISKGLAA